MVFDPAQPFNELPLLPPVADLETRVVMRATLRAARALAELNRARSLLPDPTVLINTIPLLEAHDSSEIEQVVTTQDALFNLASREDAPSDPQTKEAYRYRTALNVGCDQLKHRTLDLSAVAEVASVLLERDDLFRTGEGTFVGHRRSGRPVYTPPVGSQRLKRLLRNWEKYLQQDTGPDALIRMAVLHYQFEAIHPFPDGNGRTGRLVNVLFLMQAGLLDLPLLYLSRYLLRTRAEYYRRLLEITRNQRWEDWVLYMLKGVEETSRWTLAKMEAIQALRAHTAEVVKQRRPKIYSSELVDLVFRQPYCRIANLVDSGLAARQTASVYLKQLVDIGVLRVERAGRENIYLHPRLLALLRADTHDFAPYAPR